MTVLLAGLASACGNEADPLDLPGDVLWESAHFRYHTRAGDDSACEGVLVELERHFEHTLEVLGSPWPEGRKVDYFKFDGRDDFEKNSGCPAGAGSCARGTQVLSPDAHQPHELVHAYLAPVGLPPSFFVEGVASALNCDHVWAVAPKPFEEVVALPFGEDRVYIEGPWFVGHLLHEYGPEPFLSVYGRLRHTASLAQISAAFEEAYGTTLAEAWEDAATTSKRVRCVNRWACSGDPVPLDGSAVTFRRACDGTDVFRTFELEAERDLVIDPRGQFVYAPLSCTDDPPHPVGGDPPDGDTLTFTSVAPAAAGRYFMAPWGESAEASLRALPERAFSLECSLAGVVDLATDEFASSRFELAIPRDGPPWFVKLRPPTGNTVLASGAPEVRTEQCSDCGETPTCSVIEFDATPDADGTVLLRLTPTTPGPGYAVTSFLQAPSIPD